MLNRRFYFSWIVGAVVMYAAFYVWHGIILTDFSRINSPMPLFLSFAAITYLIISFLIYRVFEMKFWNLISRKLIAKAMFTGVTVGFSLLVITNVLGFSFSTRFTLQNFIADCVWQMIEQCLGGLVVAIGYMYIYIPNPDNDILHKKLF